MTEWQALEVLLLSILMMIEMFFRVTFELLSTFPMAFIFITIIGFGIACSIGNSVDMYKLRKKERSNDNV